ncbi:hypothetical protein [Halosimplex pelagicum]|uniref:ABC transporter permease subunit n=1 Tax=Halosimplex pelagicum TaxID=869886 RepID=A0A7D5PDI0_9EURY|nr:hypothetical protein [Halosimplex pelagicum]QLH83578.1 hypothetical protein HZS54_18930 [Halosimplex pelagicum]
MSLQNRIRTEFTRLPVAAFAVVSTLYVLVVSQTRGPSVPGRVVGLVGPDIAVLYAVRDLALVILVGGFLVGWWRTTQDDATSQTARETYADVALAVIVVSGWLIALAVGTQIPERGAPSLLRTVAFLLVTPVYATTCVGVGVATGTLTSRSIQGRVGALLVLGATLFFQAIVDLGYDIVTETPLNTFQPPAAPLYFLLHRLSPFRLFIAGVNWIYGVGSSSSGAVITTRQLEPDPELNEFITNAFVAEHTFQTVPWYLTGWAALFGLCLWLGSTVAVIASETDG